MMVQYPDIEALEPKLVFKHFAALLAIPRGSGNEAAAREYVLSVARENGIEPRVDGVGNVVVPIPATPGYEGAPTVVLQVHLDIVCEKNSDVKHNFLTDPVPAYVDGDNIRTRGTTLGADNGIGGAATLAIIEDQNCIHGPLEILFTVDEETGMTGAFCLGQGYPGGVAAFVTGRTMMNLDSEDEGTLFVGCAGGADTTISLDARMVRESTPERYRALKVKVSGLKGGHSGLDIALGRGNALRILAQAIYAGSNSHLDELGLVSLCGGNKRNAIPREAEATIFIDVAKVVNFRERVEEFMSLTRAALGKNDPDLLITVGETETDQNCLENGNMLDVFHLLLALPHGPLVMSQDISGMVQTSTCLSMVEMDQVEGQPLIAIRCLSRSSVEAELDATTLQIRTIAGMTKATVKTSGKYPGWKPNMDSHALAQAKETWMKLTGKKLIVTCIHAGLECGVIGEQVPGMDMVSFGPEMHAVHSPDEYLSIPSTRRFYMFLGVLLNDLAQNR